MRLLLAWILACIAAVAHAASPPPSAPDTNAKPVPVIPLSDVRGMSEAGMLDWLKHSAVPFASAAPSSSELAPLLDALGHPRVVGIGEITHGTHEDLAFKSALIQALIERGDIDTLVFELNRRSGERLDRFVAAGSTEVDAAAAMRDAKVYGVWMTHELADLLDRVRTYNARAPHPVRIVGVDVQDASADLDDGLRGLERIDATEAARLRGELAPWLTAEAMKQHQSATVRSMDTPTWTKTQQAARVLAQRLQGRDAAAASAADAGLAAIETTEYDVPGKAATFFDTPADVAGRRDAAMARRLLQSVPENGHAIFWAHNDHVSRGDLTVGMGLLSAGANLHAALGPSQYRIVAFTARDITFNAKAVANARQADRTAPYEAWHYTADADDLATVLARVGAPRFWADVSRIPPGLPGIVFRMLPYRQPSFGWNASDPFPVIPAPFGYQADVLVYFDTMTPSRRL